MQRPETVRKIILASCTLHNMLADMHPGRMQQAADREDPITHAVQPGEWRQHVQETALHGIERQPGNTGTGVGKRIREYLTEYYNDVGAVSWQNKMVGLRDIVADT